MKMVMVLVTVTAIAAAIVSKGVNEKKKNKVKKKQFTLHCVNKVKYFTLFIYFAFADRYVISMHSQIDMLYLSHVIHLQH